MGDQQHRGALVHEPAEQLGERLLVLVVDAGCRLVHDEQVGVARERPCDERPLLLAAGQLGERGAQAVGEADAGDGADDGVVIGLAGEADERPAREPTAHDDLLDRGRDAGDGARVLWYVSQPTPVAELRQRRAEQLDLPLVERDQSDRRPHQGRLARPVGAEQCDDLALGHLEVDPAEDRPPVEGHRSAVHGQTGDRRHEQEFAFRIASRLRRIRDR